LTDKLRKYNLESVAKSNLTTAIQRKLKVFKI